MNTIRPMNAVDALLMQLDQALDHPFESLGGIVDGVAEEEAQWQAPAWRGVTHEEGCAAPGTIAWQVAHVADCKAGYARTIMEAVGRDPGPETVLAPARSFAEALERLRAAHLTQRVAIESLLDEDLARPVGNAPTLAEFLVATIRHDTWHAGQIAVVRRLYRESGNAPGA